MPYLTTEDLPLVTGITVDPPVVDKGVVRSNSTGDGIQGSLVVIDDDGSITLPALETVDGRDVSVDGTKLDTIETGATADQTITAGTGLTGGGTGDVTLGADFGTGAGKVTQGNDPRLSDSRTPTTHASTHQHGGTDEVGNATSGANRIPKADGSGKLDTWISSGTTSVTGLVRLATDGEVNATEAVNAADLRLSNSRTPTAHAVESAGGFHTASGLTPGYVITATSGTAFSFQPLPAPTISGYITGVELDWGPDLHQTEKEFVVVDAAIAPGKRILVSVSDETPTGKGDDEIRMESLLVTAKAGVGALTIWMRSLQGSFTGPVWINYLGS